MYIYMYIINIYTYTYTYVCRASASAHPIRAILPILAQQLTINTAMHSMKTGLHSMGWLRLVGSLKL